VSVHYKLELNTPWFLGVQMAKI